MSGSHPSEDEALAIMEEAGCNEDVIRHVKMVHGVAVKILERLEGKVEVDAALVRAGALLHDIGRSTTHGIMHAVEGARIARELGLDQRLVRIIERHVGGGITEEEASSLGLPEGIYTPETLEEKIIAGADNLIGARGKHSITREIMKLEKKGKHGAAERVRALHDYLSELCGVDIDDL